VRRSSFRTLALFRPLLRRAQRAHGPHDPEEAPRVGSRGVVGSPARPASNQFVEGLAARRAWGRPKALWVRRGGLACSRIHRLRIASQDSACAGASSQDITHALVRGQQGAAKRSWPRAFRGTLAVELVPSGSQSRMIRTPCLLAAKRQRPVLFCRGEGACRDSPRLRPPC